MAENKNKVLLTNTAIFMIGSIGSKFIQFFLVPLYTYTLSTAEFGITELVLTAASLLQPLFSMSIADGLLRFGLDENIDKNQVRRCSFLLVGLGTLIAILCTPLFQLERTLKEWLLFFLAIMILRIYRDVFAINLKIDNKNQLFATDGILYTFSLCIFSFLFLVPLKMGIAGYFWANIVANALSILFLLYVGHPLKGVLSVRTDRKLLKEILLYSLPMILNGISWWITNSANRFMISYYLTDSDVGIYSVASKIPLFISTFTGVFCQAWIISAVIEFDNDRDKKFYAETFQRYSLLLFLSASVLIAFIRPFMSLYVSPEYGIAWKYVPVLIISTVFSSLAAFYAGIYAAAKKNINVMITTIGGALLNIVINALLIPTIGIMGAAIATMISWFSIFLFRSYDVSNFFDFSINKKEIVVLSLITAVQCMLVMYMGFLGSVSAMFLIVLVCLVGRNGIIEIINLIIHRYDKGTHQKECS